MAVWLYACKLSTFARGLFLLLLLSAGPVARRDTRLATTTTIAVTTTESKESVLPLLWVIRLGVSRGFACFCYLDDELACLPSSLWHFFHFGSVSAMSVCRFHASCCFACFSFAFVHFFKLVQSNWRIAMFYSPVLIIPFLPSFLAFFVAVCLCSSFRSSFLRSLFALTSASPPSLGMKRDKHARMSGI